MTLLTDIGWSDLCVSEDATKAWFKETPDSMVASVVPPEAGAELSELYAALNREWDARGSSASRHGFAFVWPQHGGMRLRVKRISLAAGTHVYICRAFRFKPRRFHEIGIAPPLAMKLLSPEIRGGIGIFLGRPGSGKTTTACTYVQERALRLGGVTYTIESPVEVEVEGRYENGYIHQREVEEPDMMAEAIRDLARATPNVLFVGEVLDESTAEMVTQASKMGFLVLCTYHGGDLINGIERFARAAGRGQVSAQFVEAFRFAVHIDLRRASQEPPATGARDAKPRMITDTFEGILGSLQHAKGPHDPSFISSLQTGNPPRVLSTRSLFCLKDEDPLRGIMKKGDFSQLASEIDRQKNELLKVQSEMALRGK